MLKLLTAGLTGVAAGAAAYGYGWERHALHLVEADLAVAGLPPPLEGLRIGLITDLHLSALVPPEDVERAIALVQAARPDVIVYGGDYHSYADRAYIQPVTELAARASAPHGVFAVLGNHDDQREMPAALTRRGIEVLRNTHTTLHVRGEQLTVAGVDFWVRNARSAVSRAVGGARAPVVLLAHDPRRLYEAADLGVGAVLSGHTHGGQVVLPLVGAPAARRFPVAAGIATHGHTSLFVSRGVGTVVVPIRVNCPPEVAVITLRRPVSTAAG